MDATAVDASALTSSYVVVTGGGGDGPADVDRLRRVVDVVPLEAEQFAFAGPGAGGEVEVPPLETQGVRSSRLPWSGYVRGTFGQVP